ncbi:MAG TPA: hypothetical protein EYP52_05575, partial [Anaerolineae bacterium]|nr:hypothetical protein [Anaerolineae bacterium]
MGHPPGGAAFALLQRVRGAPALREREADPASAAPNPAPCSAGRWGYSFPGRLRGPELWLGDRPKRARSQIGYVPQYTRFDPAFPINAEDVDGEALATLVLNKLRGLLNVLA